MTSVFLIGTALNSVIFIISIVYTTQWKPSVVYFNLGLFICIVSSFTTYLTLSKQMAEYPHLYRVGAWSLYVFLGGLVLFSQKLLKRNVFRLTDLLFFVPSLLFLIDLSPFFLQSAEEKRQMFLYDYANGEVTLLKKTLFLSSRTHFYLQSGAVLIVSFYQCITMIKLLNNKDKSFLIENKQLFLWNLICASVLGFSLLPNLIPFVKGTVPSYVSVYVLIPTFLGCVFFSVSLLFMPKILYGSKGFWSQDVVHSLVKTDKNVSKVYFTAEKAELMKAEVNAYMTENQPYLKASFTINQLASDNSFSTRHVSALLNNYLNMSFTDYVNQYRINCFVERYQNDPVAKKITFEALANECGFNSRFTFINAFKKQTGKTPTQYLT